MNESVVVGGGGASANHNLQEIMRHYNPSAYSSKPFMTIYEKTCVLGLRMEQLANNAPTYLAEERAKALADIRKIAEEELREKKIPFIICRTLPTGVKEYWRLDDLAML